MRPQRIGIVGLGIAGATVGALLARQGHSVMVFEQAPNPGPVGAGLLIQPSGQMVLERLGLLEGLMEKSEQIERIFARTFKGRVLVDLAYEEGRPAMGVSRGELFTQLVEMLRASGATVRAGVRAGHYEVRPTHVTLYDERGEGVRDLDYLIACDGARSALRGTSKVPALVQAYPHGAVWATGKCAVVRGKLLQVTRRTRNLCGVLPMGGGACALFWSLREDEREAFFARGFTAWREEVLALCPESAEVFETVKGFEQVQYAPYMHVRMPAPFDERCVFLGDAAHAMSPHLGQGANLALIDAWCFAAAMAGAEEFGEACRRYAAMRRRHVRAYSMITYMLSPFFQSRGVIKAVLRNTVLPLMPKVPWVRKQMVVTMSGLRGGLLGGRLKLPEIPGRERDE